MQQEDIERIYRRLYQIRRVEENVASVYKTDVIKSPVHLSIGQEAVSVGVCEALASTDIAFGSYRGHALYLAKGGDLRRMIAELYGKIDGCCHGKGGSMHLIDPDCGVMGTSAVVGTTISNAIGYSWAMRARKEPGVVAVFFGDGAVEEGTFHESMNFAALHRLPVLFICENNQYAIHTHVKKRQSYRNISKFVAGYGIDTRRIEGNDLLAIRAAAIDSVAVLKSGSGPVFLECETYRWREHVGPGEDYDLGYRSRAELEPWLKNDQLPVIAEMISSDRRKALEQAVEAEVSAAFRFAEDSAFPPVSELHRHVFSAEMLPSKQPEIADVGRSLSYAEAIREATDQLLEESNDVVVFGLDVDDPKRIQGTTKDLVEKYGGTRVFGTPLSEDAMTGVAIGMALCGMRPLHIHIRMDFLMLAMNQIVNVAAKCHYMFGGRVTVPMVVRSMIGKSWGQGAQHSQGLYPALMNIPGLKVAAPSNPYDAKGCLIAASRDGDPVMFVEHRLLHFLKGPVPADMYEVKAGARILKAGTDVTMVGISNMAAECLRASKILTALEINAEVIDPVWLNPLDSGTIADSAARTKHLCVVDNAWSQCGAGAEIITRVLEILQSRGVTGLKVCRLGFAPTTCPPAPTLEKEFYPDPRRIAVAAAELLRGAPPSRIPDVPPDEVSFFGPF